MASGTIYMNFSGSRYGSNAQYIQGRLVWSSTPSPATNTSRVSVNLQIRLVDNTGNASDKVSFQASVARFMECGTTSRGTALKESSDTALCNMRYSWTTIKTFSFTVAHDSSGACTAYIGATAQWQSQRDWFLGTGGRYAITLDTIKVGANITSAPNFNDEENPTITYSNASGSSTTSIQACISLTGAVDDVPYREIPLTGTSYTFTLTDAERELLRNATLDGSTKRNVRFYVKSVVNGTTYFKYLEREFEVINSMPEIHATYYDVNENTVRLTGNSDLFILGYSDAQFQVEATPKKGASIVGYNTFCGSKSSTLQKSTFYWVEDDKITFTATDNRGQAATLILPLETIEYLPITCDIEVGELTIDEAGEATASVPVKISGDYFNGEFGADGIPNELKIELKHTGTADTWVELTDGLVPIVEGNKYTLEIMVRGLDYKKQLSFQARASDEVGSAESLEEKVKLVPVFDWSEEDFNFNVPVSFQGDTMADFIIETGTESMGSNGTWYWEKWKSGKAVCYGCRNFGAMAITKTWGGLYRSEPFTQDLPSIFANTPEVIDITFRYANYGAWIAKHENSEPSASDSGSFIVVRPASATLSQSPIGFHVIGRWK